MTTTEPVDFERFELDEFKIRLLEESERAQKVTQKYVDELSKRISILQDKLSDFINEEEKVQEQIEKINKERETTLVDADTKHKDATTAIINSFGFEPPWDAKFERDQDNRPSVVLIRNSKI